jgi:hypothetical protein
MFTIPTPRPWMPLRRRRFELAHTFVSRAAHRAHHDVGQPRSPSLTRARLRRRGLFRRARRAYDLRLRLDELAAEMDAWIAELKENDRSTRPLH